VYSTIEERRGKLAITHVKVLKKTNKTALCRSGWKREGKPDSRAPCRAGSSRRGDKFYGTGKTKAIGWRSMERDWSFAIPYRKRLTFDSPAPTEWR
jgi:hypothetical protein